MSYTEHGLWCGTDQDYGATALIMQHDALAIEAALDSISDSLDLYYARPSVVLTGTVAQTGIAANTTTTLFPTWAATYVNSVTLNATFAVNPTITLPRTGIYRFGGYMPMTASGAITALSDRVMTVTATGAAFTAPLLGTASYRTRETSTGGERLSASAGRFYAEAGSGVRLAITFSHGNVASTMNVGTGALLWCYYDTSGVEIGSA